MLEMVIGLIAFPILVIMGFAYLISNALENRKKEAEAAYKKDIQKKYIASRNLEYEVLTEIRANIEKYVEEFQHVLRYVYGNKRFETIRIVCQVDKALPFYLTRLILAKNYGKIEERSLWSADNNRWILIAGMDRSELARLGVIVNGYVSADEVKYCAVHNTYQKDQLDAIEPYYMLSKAEKLYANLDLRSWPDILDSYM